MGKKQTDWTSTLGRDKLSIDDSANESTSSFAEKDMDELYLCMLVEHAKITEEIKNTILDHATDVLAIFYIGSWAHKEMSYTVEDGHVSFLNDIDVLVVTKKKMTRDEVKALRDETSRAINPNYIEYEDYVKMEGFHNLYVDIRSISIAELTGITPRIKYYDIFTDPSIVYLRDSDDHDLLPKIELEDIPLTDGLVHLFNRMALLVEWQPSLIKQDKTLIILVLKAYSAILEALLLLQKRYVVPLREKVKVFHEIYEHEFDELHAALPDLANRLDRMVDMKVNFGKYYPEIGTKDILDIWNGAREDSIIVTIYMINAIYKTNFGLSTDAENTLQILKFLEKKNGFVVNHYVRHHIKKHGIRLPKPLMPLTYLGIRYLYFSKFSEFNGSSRFSKTMCKSLRSTKEPTSVLYLTILSLLAGIAYSKDEVRRNELLVSLADDYLTQISINGQGYPDTLTKFREVFRIWELFTFER
ncbi:hypothetical protein ACFLX5_03400 [Chloroflexota bacterium]